MLWKISGAVMFFVSAVAWLTLAVIGDQSYIWMFIFSGVLNLFTAGFFVYEAIHQNKTR